jgi:hypothetical protein
MRQVAVPVSRVGHCVGGDDFLLVCGLGAVGREVTLLVSFVVAMLLMGASSVFEWPCCVC